MRPRLRELPSSNFPKILLCLSPPILRSRFFLVGEEGNLGQVTTLQIVREFDASDLLPDFADRFLSPLGAAVLIERVPQKDVEVFVRHSVQLAQTDNVEPYFRPLLPTLVALKFAQGLAMLLRFIEVLLMPILSLFFPHFLEPWILFVLNARELTHQQLSGEVIVFWRE